MDLAGGDGGEGIVEGVVIRKGEEVLVVEAGGGAVLEDQGGAIVGAVAVALEVGDDEPGEFLLGEGAVLLGGGVPPAEADVVAEEAA